MKRLSLLLALGLSMAAATAQSTFQYTASLDAAQDGGGARTGSGSGTLSLTGNALTFNNISFSGLSANSSGAHIHGPAGPLPASAGVLYGLSPAFVTLGSTSGNIAGTLSLVEGQGGFTLSQQMDQLNSGLWYINVHSGNFPGGEIRGQITAVPEPSTLALLAIGAGGFLVFKRRRS